jgi:AraC-like DNA-binding protein
MAILTGFLRTLILLGALQGVILSGMLYFSTRSRQSNRILAILIFLMALASLNLYLIDTPLFNNSWVFNILSSIIPLVIIMPIGPLIYFYIRTFSDPDFKFNMKFLVHFIPVIIDLIPKAAALIYITGLLLRWIPKNDAPWGNFIDQVNMYSDIPRWLSISIYLWISYRYLKSLKNKNAGIKGEQQYFPWLGQFVRVFTIFQMIWLLFLVPYIIPRYSDRLMDAVGWYPVYIPLSILIYWLGIKGWMASSAKTNPEGTKGRISSRIPVHLSQDIIDLLKKTMEVEKLYLDPALNLSLLTKHTGIPSKTISAVLNQQMNKSFNEFINEYRVVDIKKRLLASGDKNLTIAGIAYECGFNSQPTFQRAFKAIQGESPSEFLLKNTNSVKQLA